MNDENQDDLESENQDNGGETVDQKTTGKDADTKNYKQIAEDQRKRAEIAEAKLKEKPADLQTNKPSADADELRLIARGLSDEEIEQAKVIAKGTETTIAEAIKSPLFVAFQKELKEQERKEKAKLNASKGSVQDLPDRGKSLVDMTPQEQKQARAEHEKAAMQAAANIQ